MVKKWSDKIPQRSPLGAMNERDDAGLETIVLVTGTDADGNPQWAYAEIPADNFIAFKEAEGKGNYRLQDFGTILSCGPGENPPQSVQQEMADKYGCDINFESELEEMFGDFMEQLSEMIEQFSHLVDDEEPTRKNDDNDSSRH